MALFCPYEWEDPAFRASGRLPNLRYGDEVRAIWVTRFDYHTRLDIARVMHHSALAGFNTVFFQVRGNATTYYPSKLEPWSEAYGWKDPGFDPLASAVTEAHAHNMALHAWVNVMPMWRGSHPPINPEHMYNLRLEWSWYNRFDERQPLNRGFYVSINPCLPEARHHIVEVCKEMVSGYNIDGLHLDYIRSPNEPPVINGMEYSRDKRTVRLFQADTGATPDMDRQLWNQWRCDCVTTLLRDIRRSVKSLRPQLVLTAAVGADRKQALSKFQDVGQWWKERLLDAVVPMNYTGCQKTFRSRVEHEWQGTARKHCTPLITKLCRQRYTAKGGLVDAEEWKEWARPPEPAVIMGTSLEFGDSSLHQRQLFLALQRFGHFSIFCYSSLFGLGCKSVAEKHGLLLPFLKILADASGMFSSSEKRLPVYPFRVRDKLVHPEEKFPDQLHFLEQVPCGLAFRHVDEHRAELTLWGKRKIRKVIYGYNNDNFMYCSRRTHRRILLKKHQKKAQSGEDGKMLFFSQSRVKDLAHDVDEILDLMPMENWEAAKMSEAIGEEDNDLVAVLDGIPSHRNLNFISASKSWSQVDVFSGALQVKAPQSKLKVSTAWGCTPLSYLNQYPVHIKSDKRIPYHSSLLTQLATTLFTNWRFGRSTSSY